MPRKMKMSFIAQQSGYSIKADAGKENAELALYGAVVKRRPYDHEKVEESREDYIVESEILSDLKKLAGCKRLEIRINSCGGECNTAIVIHNKLREMATNGTEITCTVDGVAMSAGSHIMCAADKVKASSGSLIMVHKASMLVCGYANADELRKWAAANDAYDMALVSAYKRKTGMSEEDILKLMSDETYMTGKEAKERGFVDELIETESDVSIAACADKASLVVNGHIMGLYGAACPENIPEATALTPSVMENGGIGDANKNNDKGGKTMANNMTELREENPELAANIEAEFKSQLNGNDAAIEDAVKKALDGERSRLEKIDAIAAQVSAAMLNDAKYKNPCTAEELAYKAMTANAKKGKEFLDNLNEDYRASGAGSVSAVAPKDDTKKSEDDEKKEVYNYIDKIFGEEDDK